MPNYKDKEKKPRGRPRLPRDAKGNPIRQEKDTTIYICCSCGKEFDQLQKNFVTSSSPLFYGWGGYVPICRECLVKYYNDVVLPSFDGDDLRATEFMCGLCDWYFDEDAFNTAVTITNGYRERGATNVPMIITYSQRRNMKQYAKRGTTYLEKCKQRWEAGRVVKSASDLAGEVDARLSEVDERDVWFFGAGYTSEEYRFLREQYDDWCSRYDCQTKAQEEIFKSLAIAQLNVQRAQSKNEQKQTADAMKTLQDLMASAKIQPKQKSDTALVEQNTFGTLIQKWENEEPIPEPKEEWKDVDGIKRYISTWFFGHICKMFGLDNDEAQEYEAEIAKYTVEPPTYHADEEDGGDSIVGQKIKAMRGKASSSEATEDGEHE